MELYERNINSKVKKVDDHHLLTEASLLDLNHSMTVGIKVHIGSAEIVDAYAVVLKAPLGVCDQTVGLAKKLIGIKIERGVNAKLVQALGGCEGCTHLYELGLNAVRLTFNVLIGMQFDWKEWTSKSLPDDEFVKKATPFLRGACLPFKKT